ncbi:MAG: glutathione peroxidase [Flavobacteriaceae bacterium]|nr:glutathione peroxidase [Flavobacteriaceae bacterium]
MSQNTPSESIYDIQINKLSGEPLDLLVYKDQYILFVNVASECGFTGQYEGLQKLYDQYKDKLMVIGVPCNQFGSQEPGNSEEIQTFCQSNYGVAFIMTEKVEVKGENQHPLYKWLTDTSKNGKSSTTVKWNFQKYLIGPNGKFIDYYYSITKPLSSKITKHLK